MNVDKGHLVGMDSEVARKLFGKPESIGDAMEAKKAALIAKVEKAAALGYEPIPEELELAAVKKLAGQDEAYVSKASGGKLSRWAASRRKAKRKTARASKKLNRK